MVQDDPFAVLGLPALAELTDDDVRAAWRRIAAATHPDREDGGDPARFGHAAAAYAVLRTSFGRGEALADLAGGTHLRRSRRAKGARRARRSWSPWRSVPGGHPASRWLPQRHGAHRLPAAAPPGPPRHSGDARDRRSGDGGFRPARSRHAAGGGFRPARSRHSVDGGFRRAVYARLRAAGHARYRHAGHVSIDRGLALPAGGAALGAAAAIAAAGWTPATIGLVAGALTVTGWGLWRRAWRDR